MNSQGTGVKKEKLYKSLPTREMRPLVETKIVLCRQRRGTEKLPIHGFPISLFHVNEVSKLHSLDWSM